jgi:hypothetical protein
MMPDSRYLSVPLVDLRRRFGALLVPLGLSPFSATTCSIVSSVDLKATRFQRSPLARVLSRPVSLASASTPRRGTAPVGMRFLPRLLALLIWALSSLLIKTFTYQGQLSALISHRFQRAFGRLQ